MCVRSLGVRYGARRDRKLPAAADAGAAAPDVAAALLAASRAAAPPTAASGALALLRLWYAAPWAPLHAVGAHAEALELSGADLALCGDSAALLSTLYLPTDAPPAELAERAALLLALVQEWLERARMCEVGPAARSPVGSSPLPVSLPVCSEVSVSFLSSVARAAA